MRWWLVLALFVAHAALATVCVGPCLNEVTFPPTTLSPSGIKIPQPCTCNWEAVHNGNLTIMETTHPLCMDTRCSIDGTVGTWTGGQMVAGNCWVATDRLGHGQWQVCPFSVAVGGGALGFGRTPFGQNFGR